MRAHSAIARHFENEGCQHLLLLSKFADLVVEGKFTKRSSVVSIVPMLKICALGVELNRGQG